MVVADGGQRIFCHLGHQGGRLATTMQCRYISYKIYSPIMNISLFQDTWIENAINLLGTTCKALYSYAVHHSAGGGGCTTRRGGTVPQKGVIFVKFQMFP